MYEIKIQEQKRNSLDDIQIMKKLEKCRSVVTGADGDTLL